MKPKRPSFTRHTASLIAAGLVAACGADGGSQPPAATGAFMTAYYKGNDVRQALRSACGDAAAQLQDQLDAMANAGVTGSSGSAPRVRLSHRRSAAAGDNARYDWYEVRTEIAGLAPLQVRITSTEAANGWCVSAFENVPGN